ncbi:type VII secretion system-associated protein [Streptomyces sp. NPDC094448]|uniref:type VII secretion system-associated protein n=1 Tax=Streptomyces sp. NPDC094448 TaxID=3366063 RepID=UPI00380CD853
MSPQEVDLSHLDVEALKNFKDSEVNGVRRFLDDLAVLMTDPMDPSDPGGTGRVDSMPDLDRQAGEPGAAFAKNPLQLGRLGAPKEKDKLTAATLKKFYSGSVGSLHAVEAQQKTLFTAISQNLQITIKAMEDAQDSSLDQVESSKFLDDWASVNQGLTTKPTNPNTV